MIRYILFFILLLSISCVEEFDLSISGSSQHLVVEGLISDITDQSYVRLTYSVSGLLKVTEYTDLNDENVTFINDAVVIVSDDMGNKDTLKKAPEFVVSIYEDTYQDTTYIDTISNECYQKGYYNLTFLKPIPNHTYYLQIDYDGKEYLSQCYMPGLPKVDSVAFNTTSGLAGKSDNTIPLLYFKDPLEVTNYYLFKTGESTAEVWYYSLLNDELFNGSYVNGLDIGQSQSNIYWLNGYSAFQPGAPYYITMQSLTKEAYNFYSVLFTEFSNDGGTYKPTPSSPQSNMDNGALGFFRASSTLIFKGRMPY